MNTMAQARAWHGPALFSFGFRPFFLGGAVHAAVMVALWVPWFLGMIELRSAFPPTAWHAHELLFGYVPAIVAGFLLTAVPNWTGRLPVVGVPLGALFALWLLGRAAVALSRGFDPLLIAAAALAFPFALAAVLGREIAAGRNWRNLKVLVAVLLLAMAQALFHFEIRYFDGAIHASRLAVAVTIMLIMIIGGRIVPSFTLNWLRQNNPGRLPALMSKFDVGSIVLSTAALMGWVALPALPGQHTMIGMLLLAAGIAQSVRQARWMPHRTLREPLVTVLHAGYAFVPLGFLFAAFAALINDFAINSAALHAWTVGGIGLMTLAVMTRATRGHTGRVLTASLSTVAIYAGIVIAAFARIAAALAPEWTLVAMPVAAVAWVASFAGFVIMYGPMLAMPKQGTFPRGARHDVR
jgi:uncharacterized protein involved in response to NO